MQISIEFLSNLAPETVAAVHNLAAASSDCQGCKFYRNEAAPAKDSLGPPYGLLQVHFLSGQVHETCTVQNICSLIKCGKPHDWAVQDGRKPLQSCMHG